MEKAFHLDLVVDPVIRVLRVLVLLKSLDEQRLAEEMGAPAFLVAKTPLLRGGL